MKYGEQSYLKRKL